MFLFSSALFWGVLVIAIGLAMIIKTAFKITFSIAKVIIALVFIYFGVSIVLGIFGVKPNMDTGSNNVIFNSANIMAVNDKNEYSIIFGSGDINLTTVTDLTRKIKVSSVFGSARVILNPAVPVRIKASSAFGRIQTPDGLTATFGEHTYTAGDQNSAGGVLQIDASSAFGNMEIINQ